MLLKNLPANQLFLIVFLRMVLDGLAGVRHLAQGNVRSFFMVLKAHAKVYSSLNKTLKKRVAHKPQRVYYKTNNLPWAYFVLRKRKFSQL